LSGHSQVVVGLNAVILAVTCDQPRVLTVHDPVAPDRLLVPFGPLDAEGDRTLELSLRRWVRHRTGLELGYVEQLYSFGDRYRDPRELREGIRVLSIAYLALVREESGALELQHHPDSGWKDVYAFLPWEDRRGQPWPELESLVEPALEVWVDQAEETNEKARRQLRAETTFGFRGALWSDDRAVERYELLYELGLVQEASGELGLGQPMGLDHRRIVATALARSRGKIRYRPVIFELLQDRFTLLQLQKAVEALAGRPLHKQNFRRLMEQAGLVEGTGQLTQSRGRPAELFAFRREVLRERPAPGVGIPRI
jgi:hypothetical protein